MGASRFERCCTHRESRLKSYVRRVRAIVNANMLGGVLLAQEAARTVEEAEALAFSCFG